MEERSGKGTRGRKRKERVAKEGCKVVWSEEEYEDKISRRVS